MVRIKRIYDQPEPDDGQRILVDRLWPRGIARESARLDGWLKELAPSDGLRRWFGHDPERWEEFQARYRQELAQQAAQLEQLRHVAATGVLTLLFAARDIDRNNAVVLKEVLETDKKEQ